MQSPEFQRRARGYESDQSSDTANEDDIASFPAVPNSNNNTMPPMWQTQRQQSGSAVSRLSQKFGANAQLAEIGAPAPLRTQHRHQPSSIEISPDDDSHSRASTLGDEQHDFDYPEKTPTLLPKRSLKSLSKPISNHNTAEPISPAPAPHIPGPLESQFAALMGKLIFMERENPTVAVTPEDYQAMVAELKTLREEKKTWQKRHEALYALRDEDVENNIKIRGMLAKARRELEGMTKLRDEDLVNVQVVRSKLAEATRKIERMEGHGSSGSGSAGGRTSPSRMGRPGSMMMERRNTTDLFAAAQAAAFQQRALDLEKRNSDLLAQVELLKGGASIDDLNRLTAHKAWKDTVTDLESKVKSKDAEISRLRTGGLVTGASSAGGGSSATPSSGLVEWHRVEAIHEEHANYRERVGSKMQALRGEKEALQRDLHRKEDECHGLEVKVSSLQRRLSVM